MRKKLTVDDFIKRARNVHGDIYDYSKVVYKNSKTKVIIICSEHGEFSQSPEKHWIGQGCPFCSQKKLEETNMQKYGVRRPLQNEKIQQKMEETTMQRYGVRNSSMCDAVMEKRRQTNRERYGVDYTCQADSVIAKKEKTLQSLYGGNSPFSSQEVQTKARKTIRERYGVENVAQNADIQVKMKKTCMERYGVEYALSSSDVQEKKMKTMVERYGGNCPFVSTEIREKSRLTNIERYGVSNPMQSDVIANKVLDTKKENNTFHTSSSEELLYTMLCEKYGEQDIERQFMSDVYPFPCDFYIKSRDMYIELNGLWTHGMCWFDKNNTEHLDILSDWQEKALDSEYYDNAVNVWTNRDVVKRQTAYDNHLNYVVFWDNKLRDVELWFVMGCPDGQDYNCMYSWLPSREIVGMDMPDLTRMTSTHSQLSLLAKYYQFDVFYKDEYMLWNSNMLHSGILVQMYLYWNRWVYLHKLPMELTDLQIMRGFTISGIHKGHTVFNTTLMDKLVQKYEIQSVYDPCAGWGERMLYCYYHNMQYIGRDINVELKNGYDRMISDLDMASQSISFENSAVCKLSGFVDAVITCPPYGDIEIYSENGAENLSHDDFLDWWRQVIQNSLQMSPQYFCFQINQKWRSEMLDVVEDCGFQLIDELYFKTNQSSHFTRKKGGINVKKEYESMLVCKRV